MECCLYKYTHKQHLPIQHILHQSYCTIQGVPPALPLVVPGSGCPLLRFAAALRSAPFARLAPISHATLPRLPEPNETPAHAPPRRPPFLAPTLRSVPSSLRACAPRSLCFAGLHSLRSASRRYRNPTPRPARRRSSLQTGCLTLRLHVAAPALHSAGFRSSPRRAGLFLPTSRSYSRARRYPAPRAAQPPCSRPAAATKNPPETPPGQARFPKVSQPLPTRSKTAARG